jgi:hypothetical protein
LTIIYCNFFVPTQKCLTWKNLTLKHAKKCSKCQFFLLWIDIHNYNLFACPTIKLCHNKYLSCLGDVLHPSALHQGLSVIFYKQLFILQLHFVFTFKDVLLFVLLKLFRSTFYFLQCVYNFLFSHRLKIIPSLLFPWLTLVWDTT